MKSEEEKTVQKDHPTRPSFSLYLQHRWQAVAVGLFESESRKVHIKS